ncbi:MAG: PDZ domain-containing protein, partial [Melioribacteraceae bacterium]
LSKTYKLGTSRGVIITEVQRNSPAQKAGLQVGDIVTGVNGFRVNDETTLGGVIQEFRTGDTIDVKVLRDNKQLIIKMKLEKMK